jgi:group II intron reverse transcriptase/maturase
MNATKDGTKDRQLHKEGYPQKASAEQREYAEASAHARIAENNHIVTSFQTDKLLERILHRDNMNAAYKKVKSNKGAGGVDGMSVDELLPFLKANKAVLLQKLKEGKYKPNPVRRVEIPKEERGKTRGLGIPTVVDRVVQQAVAQELTPIYEKQFSENSYGFRPGRSQHDALKQCQRNVDDGYAYVVDMDLEKFFDTVCQSKLIEVLSRTIEDGRVISLIHKYLNAGAVSKGMFERTETGMPQGGPLSPLLSNVMLNELDKELAGRGHRFVRYADDILIFCKSKRAAERTMASIVLYIEGKLFLRVNREKTAVAHVSKVKFLGYGFYRYKGKCKFRVHPKSISKMKDKIRELTRRSNGWGNEYRVKRLAQFVRGWVNYFKLADMKTLMLETDEWLRRKIRVVYWKQWKRVRTRFKRLQQYGIPKGTAWEFANTRKGYWRTAGSPIMTRSLTNKTIASLGFMPMADYYLKVREN